MPFNIRHVHCDRIVEATCLAIGVSFRDLVQSSRQKKCVMAREVIAGACRELGGASFPEIGQAIGRNYHSTVHIAYQRWMKRPAAERARLIARIESILIGLPDEDETPVCKRQMTLAEAIHQCECEKLPKLHEPRLPEHVDEGTLAWARRKSHCS